MAPSSLVSDSDVRNKKLKQRRQELGDLLPIQALVAFLEDNPEWTCIVRLAPDGSGRLISLFILRNDMRAIARAFFELLMIDATYKTN